MKKILDIWLIREGEGLPVEPDVRLMRMGMIAKYLSEKGHHVTWWTSTFKHGEKRYYFNKYTEYQVNNNETLCMLHSPHAYKKNVSLSRILYNKRLGKELSKHIIKKTKPDVILCAWPLIEFADVITKYGNKNSIPVLLDIRDFWPDIFERAVPNSLRAIASIALIPTKQKTTKIMRKAFGIVAKEPQALMFGCNYAKRCKGINDEVIYMCNPQIVLSDDAQSRNMIWLNSLGVTEKTWNICVFSTLSKKSIDLETLIKATKIIVYKHPEVRLIIGGKGDAEEYLKRVAGESSEIVFCGWLNQNQMNSIMSISKCGGYCLKNLEDFKNSFSNKAVQYMSGSLPILNSLSGFAKSLINENNVGITYEEGNVESCCEAILHLYNNEDERQIKGLNAKRVFFEDFEYNAVNSKFEEYIVNSYKRFCGEN